MAMPTGENIVVRRTDHRLRKIRHEDTVAFEIRGETRNKRY